MDGITLHHCLLQAYAWPLCLCTPFAVPDAFAAAINVDSHLQTFLHLWLGLVAIRLFNNNLNAAACCLLLFHMPCTCLEAGALILISPPQVPQHVYVWDGGPGPDRTDCLALYMSLPVIWPRVCVCGHACPSHHQLWGQVRSRVEQTFAHTCLHLTFV